MERQRITAKLKIGIAAAFMISGFLQAQQSFTVEQSLDYAINNNVDVKKARIDQIKASQKVKETTGIGLPQISAQGTYNYYLKIPVQLLPAEIAGGTPGTYIPVQFGLKQTVGAGITLKQLLFNGSYLVGLQSAKAYKETSALAEEKTEISIKEGIMVSYAAIISTDENIKTLEDNMRIAEKTLNDTKETYKVGLTEEQNVEQLEYSYKNLQTNKENLKRTRTKLLMALKYLMGYPLDQEMELSTTLDEMVQKNQVLVDQNKDIDISNHIDLRLKNNALKVSELQLKYQKSLSLPSLSGFASTNYNGNSNSFTFFDKDQQWFNTSIVGLQLDIPIFSGLQRHWQTQQAKLDVTKAQLDKENTERSLKNEYYGKSVDYNNAFESYKTAQDQIKLSSSIYRKEQIKFKEGLGSSFDLQNSETQLYNSQSQLYESAINLIQAKVALDKAKGEL
ncbi:Outer membrane protein TolC [Chryseobacterium wanjuense]|jgi:outer membrane protein TolC|uniref:Outer membrane protein TolC n=1 Tax=Chryseobacterium wanjuense TaxID=356305 RepID=A0A1I0PAB5_9FLAO|nr:TolC family protein [Chryseobacterium wanjuense]SEW11303.1 Outer membrane protein TolC [Chryseobacterium wanjuense]